MNRSRRFFGQFPFPNTSPAARHRQRFLLWASLLVAALFAAAAHAQSPVRLWVLQAPDRIAAYDPATFAAGAEVKVPPRVLEHPEYLSVNARGQLLFLPPRGWQWTSGETASAAGRLWLWDGRHARETRLETVETRGGAGGSAVTETARQCFLAAAGDALFWFENRFEKALDETGTERAVRSSARVWCTDMAGGAAEPLAAFSDPGECACGTGVCSETCPEWSFWAPEGVVGDFFLSTRFTPGQLESTFYESRLYRRKGGTWRLAALPQPAEEPLAADRKGDRLVTAEPDAGCCGWANASDDRALLWQNGTARVLYDEFDRFHNQDYDVSFFTADARLAPSGGWLAYTLAAAGAEGEIRLADGGTEDPDALAQVRRVLDELPMVEIVPLENRLRPTATIRRAGLVGWLSDGELLVATDGRLAVYDTSGNRLKETGIRVRSAADAFLR